MKLLTIYSLKIKPMTKKIILLFTIFSIYNLANAQDTLPSFTDPIVNQIYQLNQTAYSGDSVIDLNNYLDRYQLYELNFNQLNEFVNSNLYFSEFKIRLGEKDYVFNIQRNDIRSPHYFTTLNNQTSISRNINDSIIEKVETFKGYANFSKDNYIRVTVSNNNFWGYVYDSELDQYIFFQSLSTFLNNQTFSNILVVYNGQDLKNSTHNNCELGIVSGNYEIPDKPKGMVDKCTPRYLQIATESDYEFYQIHGQNTNRDILSLLNLVEGVYSANFNLMFEVVFQHNWSIPNDPYNSTTAFNRIAYEFSNYWNSNFSSIERDISLYFTGLPYLKNQQGINSVTGISLTTNITNPGVVCKYPNLSYSIICDQAGKLFTCSHEIGHTLNMPHPFDITGNTECSNEPGIMCYGQRKYFFNQSSIDKTINYLNDFGQCLGNFQDENNITPWVKSYSNYRNNRWIGTWFYSKGDQKIVGDFDGDDDEEILFISNKNWSNMVDYSCNTGSDWYHMWSNMGNRTIGSWFMNSGDKYLSGDFDGDGITDLLAISASNKWASIEKFNHSNLSWSHMWSNMGNGWISGWHIKSTDKFIVSDFDGDGKDEVLCFSTSGWSSLIDYDNGQFTTKWTNNGNGYIGGVIANSIYRYTSGNFSVTNKKELLTWVNNWVTLIRWNNSTNAWDWIWSQYGSNNFANMNILPLNNQQRILSGDFDTDSKDEVVSINNSWVASADFTNNQFVQNWNNWTSLGYFEDLDLGTSLNEYFTVKSTILNKKHIFGLQLSSNGTQLLVASSYRGNELFNQNKNFSISEFSALDSNKSLISIYPNPNNGNFNILINDQLLNCTIKIVDLKGIEVFNSTLTNLNSEINLVNLQSGIYILNLESENQKTQSFKFIKQ